MKPRNSDHVMQALAEADHAPGWNNRPRTIRRFDVPGGFGHGCTLYVVPYRRFANRRQELATAAWRHELGRPHGTAA